MLSGIYKFAMMFMGTCTVAYMNQYFARHKHNYFLDSYSGEKHEVAFKLSSDTGKSWICNQLSTGDELSSVVSRTTFFLTGVIKINF